MAEGDTILRAARRIEAALCGEAIAVTAPSPRGRATGVQRLDGRTLETVETKGKNLLLGFGDLILHSHLGMNGSWRVYRRGATWGKPARGAWGALAGGGFEAVQFGGPTLRVLPASAKRRDPKLAGLGPDVLATDFDLGRAVRSLRSGSNSTLGELLLDQSRLAGIGNIFKSEACFAARANPWRRMAEVPDAELEEVVLTARRLMQDAVVNGRHPHRVYRRAGRPCPVCRTPISARAQGDDARTTYWCSRCQAAEIDKAGLPLPRMGN